MQFSNTYIKFGIALDCRSFIFQIKQPIKNIVMANNPIRAIIVDDESESRDILAWILEENGSFLLLAKAKDAHDALDAIEKFKPDMLFVDINMPGTNGIELARAVHETNKEIVIVFVTAHEQYAIQAIKLEAFDYLLKPVDPDEISAITSRYRTGKNKNDYSEMLNSLVKSMHSEDKIKMNTRYGFVVIHPSDIIYMLADGNYTNVIFSLEKTEMIAQNIGQMAVLLSNYSFLKISRSCLINTKYLHKLNRRSRKVELEKNGEVFSLLASRDRIDAFDEVFG